MKYYFIILLLIMNNACNATNQEAPPAMNPSFDKKVLPSLGDCDEYTDYYIYQCTPFKCTLPIEGRPGVTREMQTFGFKDDTNYCIHNVTVRARHESFQPANFYYHCSLSEDGRLQMADLFTRYKKGDVSVYQKRPNNKILNKECY